MVSLVQVAKNLEIEKHLPGDIARYAYRPAGQEDTTLLLLTRRRTVVVTPNQVRSYARDSVRRDMDLILHGGLAFRLVIYGKNPAPVADTVYRSLSFRDMMLLRSQLNRSEKVLPARRRVVPAPAPPPAAPKKPPPPAPRRRTRTGARRPS